MQKQQLATVVVMKTAMLTHGVDVVSNALVIDNRDEHAIKKRSENIKSKTH